MNEKRYFVIVLALFAMVSTTNAQEVPLTHFTSESETNALPNPAVTLVHQDRQGYIWLANYGTGLLRYDGRSFEIFGTEAGLIDEYPWRVGEDAYGRLWVRFTEGFIVSEKPLSGYRDDERIRFVDSLGVMPLLSEEGNFQIDGVFLIDGSRIWASSIEHGILRYTLTGESTAYADTIRFETGDPPVLAKPSSFVLRLDGSVWAASFSRLLAFDGPNENLPRMIENVPCSRTDKMLEDRSGVLWGGCADGTVWQLNGETFRVVPGLAQNQVTGLIETNGGHLLVSSLGGGVVEVDPADPQHLKKYSRQSGMIDDLVWSILEDREGNIWIAQNGGLSRLRLDHGAFSAYTGRSYTGEHPILPAPDVNALITDFRVQGNGGEKFHLVAGTPEGLALIREDGATEHVGVEQGLDSPIVLGVCDDGMQNLWFSTRNGIGRLAWGAGRTGRNQLQLFGDPVDLTLYAINHSSGCSVLSLPVDSTRTEHVPAVCFVQRSNLACTVNNEWYVVGQEAGLPDADFWDVQFDSYGHLLVAGKDFNLYRSTVPLTLDILQALSFRLNRVPEPGTRVVTQDIFDHALAWPEKTPGSFSSLVSAGGSVWSVGGVVREIKGNPPRFGRIIDDKQGLVSTAAAAAYDDSTGMLWIGGTEGLYEADLRSGKVLRRITRQDGLISENTWGPKAVQVGRDGNIYIGTPRGLAIYRPGMDQTNTVPPRVAIRMARIQQDNSGHNEAAFTYTALTFTDERRVKYRTRLVGYDEWSADTTEASIRYTNLDALFVPRQYTFEVVAANSDGVWSDTPAQYTFSIRPAWWAAWPAFILYALLLGAVVYVVDRVQRRRIIHREQEKARERELEQARQIERAYEQLKRTQTQLIQQEKLASLGQLTAGIAHEIKNPLNFVNNFSLASRELVQELKQVMKENPDVRLTDLADLLEDLEISSEKIELHGKRADNIVRSMLMHARGSSGERAAADLNTLLDESVNLAFHSMRARVSEFNCTIERMYAPALPSIEIIAQDIGRVFLNLLNNAFYSVHQKSIETGEPFTAKVSVTTKRAGDFVQVSIEDNGTGIPKDTREKIFEPFFTTKPAGLGTGLGLSLAYDIVTQGHEGRLEVESEEGRGSVFTIWLPMTVPVPQRVQQSTSMEER